MQLLVVAFIGLVLMPPQSHVHMTLGDLTGFHADSLMQGVIVQLDHVLQHVNIPVLPHFYHVIPQG